LMVEALVWSVGRVLSLSGYIIADRKRLVKRFLI